MPRFNFGTDDPNVAHQIMALMTGSNGQAGQAPAPTPPPGRPTALPAAPSGMPPAPSTPPPPPAPTAPPASVNPRLDNVIRLMDAYAKAGHKVDGVRKVLAQVQLQRAQDASEEQLIWLEQAFANTAWSPG